MVRPGPCSSCGEELTETPDARGKSTPENLIVMILIQSPCFNPGTPPRDLSSVASGSNPVNSRASKTPDFGANGEHGYAFSDIGREFDDCSEKDGTYEDDFAVCMSMKIKRPSA